MSLFGRTRGFQLAIWRKLAAGLALLALAVTLAGAQQSLRKVKNKVIPQYPELARKINLSATVRVQMTIAPSGAVVQAKALGGHPLLVGPAVDAAKQWRYEPAGETSTSIVEFHFGPGAE